MYLSRLMLNPRSRQVQRELANPYELHRTVYAAFPGELPPEERLLYRLDESPVAEGGATGLIVLVQSQEEPNWSQAESAAGYLLHPAECKEVSLEPVAGQAYAFRLRANPIVTKATKEEDPVPHPGWVAAAREARARGDKPDGPTAHRLGLTRGEDQRAWLARQGERHGFALERFDVFPEGLQHSTRKGGHRLSHLAVRFEGVLRVTDAVRFGAALRDGIGPAKGFGFGLLSLAPASG